MKKNVILVTFPGTSGNYSYFTDKEHEIGDPVIVIATTAHSTEDRTFKVATTIHSTEDRTFKVARVTKVKGLTQREREKASKWIVQVIDDTEYEKNMKREGLIQEIKNKLREKREEAEI